MSLSPAVSPADERAERNFTPGRPCMSLPPGVATGGRAERNFVCPNVPALGKERLPSSRGVKGPPQQSPMRPESGGFVSSEPAAVSGTPGSARGATAKSRETAKPPVLLAEEEGDATGDVPPPVMLRRDVRSSFEVLDSTALLKEETACDGEGGAVAGAEFEARRAAA